MISSISTHSVTQKQPEKSYLNSALQDKEKNKAVFCKASGLPYSKKTALLCISYPLTDANAVELIQSAMEGILEQDVQLVLTGIGTQKYQSYFTALAEKFPSKVAIIADSETNKEQLHAAANMILAASDTSECRSEIKKAMAWGVVPVALSQEGLENYNPAQERGNAFTYNGKTTWSFFGGLIRALENFRFPYDWKNISRTAMGMEMNEEDEEEE